MVTLFVIFYFKNRVNTSSWSVCAEATNCSRGRVVKALDLKSNGVSPRRFESCRLRTDLLVIKSQLI